MKTKTTKASPIAKLVSFLKTLKLAQLNQIVRNFDEFKKAVLDLTISKKEKISLQCLKDTVRAWKWTQEQKDRFGEKMAIVPAPKDVWSGPDAEFLDRSPSRFGEATITAEEFPFSLERIDTSYRVLTEVDLFPNENFVGMTVLEATRLFIRHVDSLNQVYIAKTGKCKFYIPGLEVQQFFHGDGDCIYGFVSRELWYHYVAASFRHHSGELNVPCSSWDRSSLDRFGNNLFNIWTSNDRFLVLKVIDPET